MGYRTLFYAAFFCAYACCLSSGTTLPVRDPSHGLVGSRTCPQKSRVGSNFQPLRGALFLCHDLGCVPSVCIPPSIFYQMVGAPKSDCHSWERKIIEDCQRKSSHLNVTDVTRTALTNELLVTTPSYIHTSLSVQSFLLACNLAPFGPSLDLSHY